MCEPDGYEEAHKVSKWKRAMEEEISIIKKNSIQKLVERPLDKNIIGVKWMFKTKLNADGSINKHKARLVVKGYAQVFGFDYLDTLPLLQDQTPSDCYLQSLHIKTRRCSSQMFNQHS